MCMPPRSLGSRSSRRSETARTVPLFQARNAEVAVGMGEHGRIVDPKFWRVTSVNVLAAMTATVHTFGLHRMTAAAWLSQACSPLTTWAIASGCQ